MRFSFSLRTGSSQGCVLGAGVSVSTRNIRGKGGLEVVGEGGRERFLSQI